MTGFIKPAEIHEAQKELVGYIKEDGGSLGDLSAPAREFLRTHPVTQEKENKPFRKVDGVYVTEEAFQEAEQVKPALNELE